MTKKLQILGSFGGSSVQPDYNQNDSTAADYIKNRPFYTGDLVETELVDVIAAMAESGIDWDVQEFDGTNSLYMGLYDGTLEEGKEYAITINGNQYIATATLESMGTDAICFGDFDAYFALMTGSGDGSDFNYLVVYSEMEGAGVIYKGAEALTECKIYLRERELVKIDPKYLPEGGVGYVTTEAGIETFDIVKITNDLLENDNSYGGIEAVPPEESPTEALWIYGELITSELPFKLIAGQEYKVSINNISYTSTAVIRTETNEEDGEVFEYVCIGDIDEELSENFADLRFAISYDELDGVSGLVTMINGGAFDLTEFPTEINISCPGQIEVVHKIDSKFLPDDIGGNGASNVQSDWNENNPEADGYIKNRPFYEYKDYVYIPGDVLLEEQNLVIDGYAQISSELTFVTGEKYVVVFNGKQYKCVAWDNGDGVYLIGNGNIYGGEGMGEDVPFVCDSYDNGDCYLNVTEPGEYTISINELESEEEIVAVKKIDKKFLPEDIGAQSDWNQNNESASDYIKNRPFYDEIADLETCIFSDTVFVNVENDTIASYPIYCSQPLVEGKTYNVTFNGELYECIARKDYSNICIGNGDIWGTEGTGNNEPFCISYASDGHFLHANGGKHHVRITTVLPRQRSVKINNKYLPPIFNGSWNELTDRPFGDTIFCEWDSNKEYESITIEDADEPENPYIYYKVSNNVFEQEELFGAIMQIESIIDDNLLTEEEIINENNFDEFVDGYYLFDFAVIIAKGNDSDFSRGIWVRYYDDIVRLKIYGETKKLDKKFLEDISWNELTDKPFGVGEAYEWNSEVEYDEVLQVYDYSTLVKISSKIPDRSEIIGGKLYSESASKENDGEIWEDIIELADLNPLGDNGFSIDDFIVSETGNLIMNGHTLSKGVWFYNSTYDTDGLRRIGIVTAPKKLDLSLLNDPYYYEKNNLVFKGKVSDIGSVSSDCDLEIKPNTTYVVELDGKNYVCKSQKNYNSTYYIGNACMAWAKQYLLREHADGNSELTLEQAKDYIRYIYGNAMVDTGEPFCLYTSRGRFTFASIDRDEFNYIRIFEGGVHQINEAYIPDSFVQKRYLFSEKLITTFYEWNDNDIYDEVVSYKDSYADTTYLKFVKLHNDIESEINGWGNYVAPLCPEPEFFDGKLLYLTYNTYTAPPVELNSADFSVFDGYYEIGWGITVVTAESAQVSGVTLTKGVWTCHEYDKSRDEYLIHWAIVDRQGLLKSDIIPAEIARVATTVRAPITAQVGQTIVVKTVDENGRPTDWECVDLPTGSGLPPITAEDEGKILRVVNGVPTWVSLPYAEEAEF